MRGDIGHGTNSDILTAPPLWRLAARQVLPMGLSIALIWLLWERIGALDLSGVGIGFRQVSAPQWGVAAGLTAVSFWAVGRYDAVVHRISATAIGPRAAQAGGAAAIAVAQSVGFGVVSSALVRWRLLPELSLLQSLRVALIVSLSFLGAWGVVAALFALLAPPVPAAPWLAALFLTAALGFAGLSLWRPGRLARLPLPPLGAMAAFLALASIDTLAAGLALYVLFPPDIAPPVLPFLSVFLIALGAGLISGTPGGMGPFELTLLALLPALPEAPALGAILAFRVIYYVLPALIGAGFAIAGPRRVTATPSRPGVQAPVDAAAATGLIAQAPRAEAALLLQGRLQILATAGRPDDSAIAAVSGQSLIQLGAALTRTADPARVITQLDIAAQDIGLVPALYKGGARLAAAARTRGWQVLRVANEAWIDPRGHHPAGKTYRQLRRKLRKAEQAGVVVTRADPTALPLADLADIAGEWARARGGERGFSMGVFDPGTLHRAQVFLAHQNNRLIGFMTLHANSQEWALDLMRYRDAAPDGTMHLALDTALREARSQGLARVSLAAVPARPAQGDSRLFGSLRTRLDRISGAQGLRQFKQSFAPQWDPLYLAAPTRLGLILAAIDIAREITRQD